MVENVQDASYLQYTSVVFVDLYGIFPT